VSLWPSTSALACWLCGALRQCAHHCAKHTGPCKGVRRVLMSRQTPDQIPYSRMSAAAIAALASDHGRRVRELPWLYLDSVGQEYGPVPGWTMREWLTLGRFPVGLDLRVRLPEWEHHLPLHQLYADLSSAFELPPAWPSVYENHVLQGEEADARASLAAARIRMSEAESSRDAMHLGELVHMPATGATVGTTIFSEAALGRSNGILPGVGSTPESGHWVTLPRLWMAGVPPPQRPPTVRERGQGSELLAAGRQHFAPDGLRQEEQILAPSPPQPSQPSQSSQPSQPSQPQPQTQPQPRQQQQQQQLRDLLAQSQESHRLWEANGSYQCLVPGSRPTPAPFPSTGPCIMNDALQHGHRG